MNEFITVIKLACIVVNGTYFCKDDGTAAMTSAALLEKHNQPYALVDDISRRNVARIIHTHDESAFEKRLGCVLLFKNRTLFHKKPCRSL